MVIAIGSVIFPSFFLNVNSDSRIVHGIFCAGMPYLRCTAVRGVRVGEAVEVP
jgi:hypothetical protein